MHTIKNSIQVTHHKILHPLGGSLILQPLSLIVPNGNAYTWGKYVPYSFCSSYHRNETSNCNTRIYPRILSHNSCSYPILLLYKSLRDH